VSVAAKAQPKAQPKWSVEQLETIRATLKKLQGRPLTRVCLELEEEGIRIKPAQLKGLL
jgi:hypothetical protein